MNNRRLTILQVLPKLDRGGAERVAIETAQAVQESGHNALIAAASGPLDGLARRAGAELLHVPLATKNPFHIWRNIGRLEKIIARHKVDLVHAHSRAPAWSAFYAAQRAGVHFVTTYHGAYSEDGALKKRYNAVMASGERFIAPSYFIADLVAARYGVDDTRLRVVHGGVDTQIFDPQSVGGDRVPRLSKAWQLDPGVAVILLPGRLTALKGHKLLIAALARLRHAEAVAVFVGSGSPKQENELMAAAAKAGVAHRVRLAGPCDDMPAAMMLADVVVNCSTQPESFGLTVIEAQAMGRVVVAAAHGGTCETVKPGQSGYLVPPNNAEALAETLDTALDLHLAARLELGRVARAHVARYFSLQAMQKRMLDVYAELLG